MQDYYIIKRGGPDSYPLLAWDQQSGMFRKGKPVQVTEPIRLKLGHPIPRKPQMVDYHSLPEPVVGKRIKDVLEPLEVYGTQLIPAKVKVGADFYDYWLLHVHNEITCVDRQRSILAIDEDDGDILDIEKLYLNEDILKEIPEEKRLVFVLAESTSTYIFHKKVKEAVEAIRPEGCRFFEVDGWGTGAAFT